jgi:hypothetical protein
MNWLKTLWDWLIRKTSTSPKIVLVKEVVDDDHREEPTPCVVEEERSIEELFLEVCGDLGIGTKVIDSTDALEKFEDWYTGPTNKESVSGSMGEFIKTDSVINAKFQRFVK